MKAVIYARYSSDNQREESIEGQLRECTAYCVKNDITILRTYIDRALSAKTDNRPDFQRMVKDSAKGLFDVVIVWKLDRFARNRYDSAHYKAQLRKYGVKVLSATENISEGPEGIILESMLEGMAEYYSAELSEKVIRGHTENALKCKYNGGTPTFGYVIDKDMQYQLDPRTAPVVLEMFTRYDQGATMKEIMEDMRQKGVTTVRGKKIDLNFMARLLKNRKYIGEYSYREIVTPGGIPAIVPQDLFDRVQKRLAANRKAPARHKAEDDYLLTTKLFCGTCGAMMVGESGTSASKGRKYHYYRCVNTKKNKTCEAKHKSIRKTPIENAVVNAVMAKVMDDNFVEYIADTVMDIQSRESSVLPALRHQLEETERGITNMLNAIQMGIINASTKQRLDELEDRKADIELQIIQEEMKHPMLTREDVTYWICRFRTLDVSKLEERRRLIDSFVNSVTVFDDYILITFNYKEGEERLDFTDIESSDLQSVGGPSERPSTKVDGLLLYLYLCGLRELLLFESPIITLEAKLGGRIYHKCYNKVNYLTTRRRCIMSTEIIVAIVGAFVTILTAIVTNYLTKRNQLKFEERKLKEEYYTNYVKAISDNVLMKDEHAELDDAQNRLILVGSSDVVRILMQFHDKIKPSAPPLSGEEHDRILTDLIKAMRADLYGTKKINDGYPIIHLSGKRPHEKER